MSGGIALTVYQAGAAHELWRATTRRGARNSYQEMLEKVGGNLVVDIITGASAGGINAVFLGSALSTGASFGELHDLWLETADLKNLKYRRPPESLLDAGAMRSIMEENLKRNAIRKPGSSAERIVDDLIVTLTRTNLGGRRRVLEDFLDNPVVIMTKEDPKTFRAEDFRASSADNVEDVVKPLVDAALATSAFPVVFAPVHAEETYFVDGGLLNNQPVGLAIKHIRDKRAASITRRFVMFIEPNPDTSKPPEPRKPSPAELVMQVPAMGLKGNIWSAITDLEEFNRKRDYYDDLIEVLQAAPQGPEGTKLSAFRELFADYLLRALQPGGPKPRQELHLHGLLAGVRFDGLFFNYISIRHARWHRLADKVFADHGGRVDHVRQVEWMWEVVRAAEDADFYLRWLRALIDGINQRVKKGTLSREELQTLIRVAGDEAPETTRPIKVRLYDLLGELLEALYPRRDDEVLSPFKIARWLDEWDKLDDTADGLPQLRGAFATFADKVREWTGKRARPVMERIRTLVAELDASRDYKVFHDICLEVCGLSDGPQGPSADRAHRLFECFRRRDTVDYVLDTLTDMHHKLDIRFVRISPNDAKNLQLIGQEDAPAGETQAPRKLAGEILGHMGGFLSEDWRRNDYIWGRLDAAEVLFKMLRAVYPELNVEPAEPRLDRLRQEILEDEYEMYRKKTTAKTLPKPDVKKVDENLHWIGYGDETVASLPAEVLPGAVQYVVDTTLKLARGDPRTPTWLLDSTSRLLRGISIPLQAAVWIIRVVMPGWRGAPGTKVSPGWPAVAIGAALVLLAYLVGRFTIRGAADFITTGFVAVEAALFLLVVGATLGWNLWGLVPSAVALGFLAGAVAGPILARHLLGVMPAPAVNGVLVVLGLAVGIVLWRLLRRVCPGGGPRKQQAVTPTST